MPTPEQLAEMRAQLGTNETEPTPGQQAKSWNLPDTNDLLRRADSLIDPDVDPAMDPAETTGSIGSAGTILTFRNVGNRILFHFGDKPITQLLLDPGHALQIAGILQSQVEKLQQLQANEHFRQKLHSGELGVRIAGVDSAIGVELLKLIDRTLELGEGKTYESAFMIAKTMHMAIEAAYSQGVISTETHHQLLKIVLGGKE